MIDGCVLSKVSNWGEIADERGIRGELTDFVHHGHDERASMNSIGESALRNSIKLSFSASVTDYKITVSWRTRCSLVDEIFGASA